MLSKDGNRMQTQSGSHLMTDVECTPMAGHSGDVLSPTPSFPESPPIPSTEYSALRGCAGPRLLLGSSLRAWISRGGSKDTLLSPRVSAGTVCPSQEALWTPITCSDLGLQPPGPVLPRDGVRSLPESLSNGRHGPWFETTEVKLYLNSGLGILKPRPSPGSPRATSARDVPS